jgi:hypothetical protein
MSRDGSGNYTLPQAAFTAGTTIEAAKVNSDLNDIASALTASIAKDGQTTPTANLPMGSFKHTGVANASSRTDYAAAGQVADNSLQYAADTGSADAYAIAPTPGISAYAVGQRFGLKIANTNATRTPTLAVNGLTAGTVKGAYGRLLLAGELPAGAMVEVMVSAVATGTPTFQLVTVVNPLPRGHIAGLTLSAAGSTATFGVAAGQAVDSTNVRPLALASAYTKTTSAWAVGSGNGALDTGSIANSTWYHVYIIGRSDTGVEDILVSTSVSSPTMPTNYDYKRRIGSMKTDGSAQWVKFIQDGDLFQWAAPVADISATNPGTAAVTRTLTVPTGVNVIAKTQLQIVTASGGGAAYGYLSDLATTDTAPAGAGITDTPVATTAGNGVSTAAVPKDVRTNTSAQVRSRLSFSDANVTLYINTLGWLDARGRND